MLRSTNDLQDYALRATDGPIGKVCDFYFDDQSWAVRYLVVDTGTWLTQRKVLISPILIGHPDSSEKELPIPISKEQVKHSPEIDTDLPVSRQQEMSQLQYYGFGNYWGGTGLWGEGNSPLLMVGNGASMPPPSSVAEAALDQRIAASHRHDDVHLHSYKKMEDFHIQANDGEIGHVDGMLIDAETWAIRYLVVNTSNWWMGHKVLIAPKWIEGVSWSEEIVMVNMTQKKIKDAPVYDPSVMLDREMEASVHSHYGRVGYWVSK